MGENPSRIIIQNQFTGVNVATAKKDTYVRYRGGIKSPVLTEVKKGDTLTFMEEYEEWVQVATMDGYIGFVKKKDVSSPEAKDFERDFQKEEYQHLVMEEPVNLSWHQVTSEEANAYLRCSGKCKRSKCYFSYLVLFAGYTGQYCRYIFC